MGEIKSTLDLVLERTRHLRLSPEEREAQKRREARGRIGGLLQQWMERRVEAPELAAGFQALLYELGLTDRTLLAVEALARIDPAAADAVNSRLIVLLREVCKVATEGVEAALAEHRAARDQAAARQGAELARALEAGRGICGSAVVPNLEADPAFGASAARLHAECARKLAAEATRLGLGAQM